MKRRSILSKHVLTAFICFGSLMACHKERIVKHDAIRASASTVENKDFEKTPEYDAPVDESVSAPVSITGAYLTCTTLANDSVNFQQKVGCRVEADGAVLEGLGEKLEKISWTHQAQGSAVEIKMLANDSVKGYLAVFSIQADPASIQSAVKFELSMTLDGMTTTVKTEMVMIWNEDCALPPIQFESLGEQNGVGLAILDQFKNSHGVRFSTLSGTPVVLAGYNQANPVGYYGGPGNIANYLAPNQNGGKFFITDRHKQADITDTLIIDYDKPAKEASLDLVDIDFSETYVVRALNSQNQIIDEVQYQAAVSGARDGQLSRFVVRSRDGRNTISKLQIYGFNPPGALGIGFGIDNFSARCSR